VDWRNDIRRWLRWRDVRLLLIGLLLVGMTYQFFARLNYSGPVTLEFVGYERRGTNNVDGTIVAFRLINKSGGPITYVGASENIPDCEAKPVLADEFKVSGGTLMPVLPLDGHYLRITCWYVLSNGEERIVYAGIDKAEQSWMLKMQYCEGSPSGDWVYKLPAFAQGMFLRDFTSLPGNSVISEPVHRLIASRYGCDAKSQYFMTGHQMNRNGRVTAKMKSAD
jgi:hypothetical protein